MKILKIIGIVAIILLTIFLIILTILAPMLIKNTTYSNDAALEYYGAVLAFVGTAILGVITVYQTHKNQLKTDEVNRLTLELSKKSMAMAEQAYKTQEENADEHNAPKFELKNRGSNGHYMNLQVTLKNVSNLIISGIKSISFEVLNSNGDLFLNSDNVKSKETSLIPGQETSIEFHNKEIISKNTIRVAGMETFDSMKEFTIIWKFQCEDAFSNVHYYKASLPVADSNKFNGDNWKVEKVG